MNPRTTFSDNAYFWAGIGLEKSGDYGGAIASYSEAYSKFPAEDFVPAALFRMGKAFLRISSPQEAKDTFAKLKEDYPGSPFARKASAELKRMGKRR